VERFADQLCDELNIRKVTLHAPARGPLLSYKIRPNPKSLGPKLGPRIDDARRALAAADPTVVVERLQAGGAFELHLAEESVLLGLNDIVIDMQAPDGWVGLADRSTQVTLDTRIPEALQHDGWAREIVRHVQELRKKSGLEMEDRIALHLTTDSPALKKAIAAHKDYICAETLTMHVSEEPLDGPVHSALVKIDGQELLIQLRKVKPS